MYINNIIYIIYIFYITLYQTDILNKPYLKFFNKIKVFKIKIFLLLKINFKLDLYYNKIARYKCKEIRILLWKAIFLTTIKTLHHFIMLHHYWRWTLNKDLKYWSLKILETTTGSQSFNFDNIKTEQLANICHDFPSSL